MPMLRAFIGCHFQGARSRVLHRRHAVEPSRAARRPGVLQAFFITAGRAAEGSGPHSLSRLLTFVSLTAGRSARHCLAGVRWPLRVSDKASSKIYSSLSMIIEFASRCESCGGITSSPSDFLELEAPLQDCSDLDASLTRLFAAEIMEGDNAYFCDSCQSKQTATRSLVLTRAPCVLNLQLLRFVYVEWSYHALSIIACVAQIRHENDEQEEAQPRFSFSVATQHRHICARGGAERFFLIRPFAALR